MRGVTSGAKKAISEEINSEDSSGDIRASLVKTLDLMDRCFRAAALALMCSIIYSVRRYTRAHASRQDEYVQQALLASQIL